MEQMEKSRKIFSHDAHDMQVTINSRQRFARINAGEIL